MDEENWRRGQDEVRKLTWQDGKNWNSAPTLAGTRKNKQMCSKEARKAQNMEVPGFQRGAHTAWSSVQHRWLKISFSHTALPGTSFTQLQPTLSNATLKISPTWKRWNQIQSVPSEGGHNQSSSSHCL